MPAQRLRLGSTARPEALLSATDLYHSLKEASSTDGGVLPVVQAREITKIQQYTLHLHSLVLLSGDSEDEEQSGTPPTCRCNHNIKTRRQVHARS